MYQWDKLAETTISAKQAEEIYQRCMDEASEYLKHNQSSEIKQHVIVETAIAETLRLTGNDYDASDLASLENHIQDLIAVWRRLYHSLHKPLVKGDIMEFSAFIYAGEAVPATYDFDED